MTTSANGMGRAWAGARAIPPTLILTIGAISVGCTSTTTTAVDPYNEAYVVTGYYPADLTYSTYYWADDWYYPTLYYYAVRAGIPLVAAASDGGLPVFDGSAPVSDGGRPASDGSAPASDGGASAAHGSGADAAGAIQTLARGGAVCPGQMDVTPKTAPPVCPNGQTTDERSGVTLNFRGCQLASETVQGTVDLSSMRTASDPSCGAGTTLTLQANLTVTDLEVSKTNGDAIVVPSLTSTITTAPYASGQNPSSFQAATSGELQLVRARAQAADLMFQGNQTFTLNGNQDLSVTGTMTVAEQTGGGMATLTQTGLMRTAGCCWPTGGSLTVDRTGGAKPGTTTWDFGPNCAQARRNGGSVSLPACAQ